MGPVACLRTPTLARRQNHTTLLTQTNSHTQTLARLLARLCPQQNKTQHNYANDDDDHDQPNEWKPRHFLYSQHQNRHQTLHQKVKMDAQRFASLRVSVRRAVCAPGALCARRQCLATPPPHAHAEQCFALLLFWRPPSSVPSSSSSPFWPPLAFPCLSLSFSNATARQQN